MKARNSAGNLSHMLTRGALALAVGGGLFMALRSRRPRFSFADRSVLLTGGSRGLGLVLARQLAEAGARLAIMARDETELDLAVEDLARHGAEVLPLLGDVRDRVQVQNAVDQVAATYGGIDVLINNAGIIQVGPFAEMTVEDFEEALAVHLFGPLYSTLAALPHMRKAGAGRIVNISSVGGKIAVPHLLPYGVSKFALTGLSEGLAAELRRENIYVTTVCPGLMRTGSPRHAFFKGNHRQEYAWFKIAASIPLLSTSAESAAGQILWACRKGQSRLVIGLHTKAAVLLNEAFPGVSTSMMALTNKLLPKDGANDGKSWTGSESESSFSSSWVTHLTEVAARKNNE